MQRLDLFQLPPSFRGRPGALCQLWWLVQSCLFATSPQFMYGWRRFLLRVFGAKIGQGVIIRPSVRVTYPWKLTVGDHAWIGDNVDLYTLGEITIGAHAVVSQRSYLCTGSHDLASRTFRIYAKPIVVEEGAWVATDVFIAPGVTVGRNALIGARSSLFTNAESNFVYIGSPARKMKPREFEKEGMS
ncbi:putative colanic acid biosynthesis acetyltransferase [Stutzerimonas stutzeri]|uniref:putative colanic acid biosynthesis acetyltransferase n=1 Tax=Stutzerimonas stutzeri TaxID=316 RepID=UPI0024B6C783|nr:putative colanic acid biosynthesis acetyltransferase [Stutzerimonas stutzeri]MDI9728295.1 putative colanic acid biosynthesis acetyltransferase [Stutzerimonas stutzeri]MDI9749135.1 putative colanic acid biosynthesis acetyltransferase [Stutzerimonas stutzeri]